MDTKLTPGDYDFDELSAAVAELADKAVAEGADPQFVASRIFSASMGVACKNGLTCALKHILLMQEQSESEMQKFYLRYNDVFDLSEVLKGNLVRKEPTNLQ